MSFADVTSVLGTIVGILGGLGGLGVLVVRWLVRDTIEPVRVEVHSMSVDLRVTLAALKERVEQHGHRIEQLEDRVDRIDADKVGRADLDRAMARGKNRDGHAHRESGD
jgi:hypothetical protein